jgi:UDP-N-acetylglucosamine 2-epimerase (non-hydrolysing)
MKLILIAGARPNFMKIAPLTQEMQTHPDVDFLLVHTGQHYDEKMSDTWKSARPATQSRLPRS